jgi:hypothetical protein
MPDSADHAALTATLRALEERLLDPAVRAQPGEVAALLAPEFTEFSASGWVIDRAGIINALASEAPTPARTARAFKVRALGADAALTTWRVKRDDGVETLRSSVWQRRDGRWLMVFHQGTRAAQDDEGTS